MRKEQYESRLVADLSIEKDPQGEFKRVWVEQPVALSSVGSILEIQQAVSAVVPDFKPIQAKDLHMTIAHYGLPRELFAEFKQVNPDLSFEEFMKKFKQLLYVSNQVIPHPTTIEVKQIELFKGGEVSVLRMHDSEEIKRGRAPIVSGVANFVKDLGASDVMSFLRRSPNLRFTYPFRPHITLGTRRGNPLSYVDLPRDLKVSGIPIKLEPSRIVHVS